MEEKNNNLGFMYSIHETDVLLTVCVVVAIGGCRKKINLSSFTISLDYKYFNQVCEPTRMGTPTKRFSRKPLGSETWFRSKVFHMARMFCMPCMFWLMARISVSLARILYTLNNNKK